MQAAILFSYRAEAAAKQAAPDDLVTAHLPDATKLAHWWFERQGALPLEDLQGIACLALCSAVKYFQTSTARKNNVPFEAYASSVIVQKLKTASAKGAAMGVLSGKRGDAVELKKIKERHDGDNGPGGACMTDAEICKVTGWTQRRLDTARAALRAMAFQESLDALIEPGRKGEFTVEDKLADPAPGPEETVLDEMDEAEKRSWLAQAVAALPPAARRAVSLRFGLPTRETESMALQDVIAVINNFMETRRGVNYLREARQSEYGDAAPVVVGGKGTSMDGHYGGQTSGQ